MKIAEWGITICISFPVQNRVRPILLKVISSNYCSYSDLYVRGAFSNHSISRHSLLSQAAVLLCVVSILFLYVCSSP